MTTMIQEAENPIEELRASQEAALSYVIRAGDVSLQLRMQEEFKKSLVLAAASYFEKCLTESVIHLYESGSNGNEMLVSVVRAKTVERRYHEWFDWNARNANRFFRAFGAEFKEHMESKLQTNPEAVRAVQAFLELGRLRNEVVHENYAAHSVPLTVEEIGRLYEDALHFVEAFVDDVQQFRATEVRSETDV